MPKVELLDVTVSLGGRRVLSSVTLTFGEGLHVLLGRNGAGKTTLLRVIAGLVSFKGRVLIDGRDLRGLSRRELSRLVGYCWQNPYYGFVEATVREEVESILRILRVEGNREVIDMLVPEELMGRDPTTLSGGEARRVSLASVLVADQPVWLLDEPFTNLDRDGVEALLRVVDYGRRRGKVIVVALHEVYYAHLLRPDACAVLDGGVLVFSGRWDELTDPVLEGAGLLPRGAFCDRVCR